jgi:hypothetical protein
MVSGPLACYVFHMTTRASPFVLAAALFLVGCDQLGMGTQSAPPRPPETSEPATILDLTPFAGQTYAAFVADGGGAFEPEVLGLNAADRARLWRLMAAGQPGAWIEGGGARVLVFRGCSEGGCDDGQSVVAIEAANGAVFVAVSDAAGAEDLVRNERISALLRLRSQTSDWTQ